MKLECVRGRDREYRDPETNESYYSCSQLLDVLDPGRFNRVGEQTLELARLRGVDLHKYFFYALAHHGGFIQTIPAHIAVGFEGYIAAIQAFIQDYDPLPILIEESSRNRKDGVAGTPDAKARVNKVIGNPAVKILTEIDLKTGGEERVHRTQHNVYVDFEEYCDVEQMRTLYIQSDGKYQFKRVYRDPLERAAILNAIQVLNWRRAA